jgi:hypothetical protein
MSDEQAQHWYFGPGSETEQCSGSIDDYDGEMTMPAIYRQIQAEEGLEMGLFRAPAVQYGTGPQPQRNRP